MHDAAERGLVAHSFADRVSLAHAKSVADELPDPLALGDLAAFIRSAQRAVRHGRVGASRGNASLPFYESR